MAHQDARTEEQAMPATDIRYENLPNDVKHNLTAEQWEVAQRDIIDDGESVPETAYYINLKNGKSHRYEQGERAHGPLLPAHDLAGGHGHDRTQFETAPQKGRIQKSEGRSGLV
jgi:hypothetical protein